MELSEAKERIRRIMKREDITYEAAAEAAGVSTSTVRRWCNPSDDTDISLHTFSRFAYRFDLSMDALLFPRARTEDPGERDIHREWRANMEWWEVHLSAEQKQAIMECFKAIWQVSSQTTEKQMRMTDPERFSDPEGDAPDGGPDAPTASPPGGAANSAAADSTPEKQG